MAISLTCSCGARLEIDDKFAGQSIPCPDCQRPLNTQSEPVRSVPVSGLALISLLLALAGAFTVVGSLAAIGFGLAALRQIARAPDKVGGLNFARAGMALGAAFTLLTLGALASSEVLGIDALLREFRHAAELEYKTEPDGKIKIREPNGDLAIRRPSPAWGRLNALKKSQNDLLTFINLREDAHLVLLRYDNENEEGARDKIAQRFRESDLYRSLNKGRGSKDANSEAEAKEAPGSDKKDMILDVHLGGYDRTFLLRVVKLEAEFYLLAGGARKARFGRVVEEIRQTFNSFETWKD